MTPARRLLYRKASCPWATDSSGCGGSGRAWCGCSASITAGGGPRAAPSLVPCYWHQHQLYCGKFLVEQRARGLTVGWLISPSVDGELVPRWCGASAGR